MKAVVFTKYGSPDVMELVEVEKPTASKNEVLVKIMATAVNPADNHVLSGMLRFSTGILKPRQQILGSDIAGIVAAVGPEVTGFRVGEAVFGDISGQGRGGFAEYVAVPADTLALKPANVRFEEAAAVPMTAVTALQGLRDKGQLQPGQQVLINGASGGVGTFAVQIAKALGGVVTAVVSTRNIELVRALGADHVIDYSETDFTQTGHQYDLVFDTVGNHSTGDFKRALKPGGCFVTTTFLPSLVLQVPWRTKGEGRKMVNMMARANQVDLVYLAELLDARQVVPVIDKCYPLDKVPEALRYVGQGHATGKVIVLVHPTAYRR